MLDQKIVRLLESDLEDDNKLGWEMIKAKKIPFEDVMDFVNNSKVPTGWMQRYVWEGDKFVKNHYYGSFKLGETIHQDTSIGTGSFTLGTDSTGSIVQYPTYSTNTAL